MKKLAKICKYAPKLIKITTRSLVGPTGQTNWSNRFGPVWFDPDGHPHLLSSPSPCSRDTTVASPRRRRA